MRSKKAGWVKIISSAVLLMLLPGIVWFTGNLVEYNKWWDSLPPAGEMKNIDDTNDNPALVMIRRTLRWNGSLLEYSEDK